LIWQFANLKIDFNQDTVIGWLKTALYYWIFCKL